MYDGKAEFRYLFNQGGNGWHGQADPISAAIGDAWNTITDPGAAMTMISSGYPPEMLAGAGDFLFAEAVTSVRSVWADVTWDWNLRLPPAGVEPPMNGPFTVGAASRPGENSYSLWDSTGGEWRYFSGDQYHIPHWDYNPWTKWNSPWQNVPLGH
jgi:hypothetical protein